MNDKVVQDIVVNPVIDPKVTSGIDALQKKVDFTEIIDPKDLTKASEFVKEVSDLQTNIENQRLLFTKPLNQALKQINSFFKQFSIPLEGIDNLLRGKMVKFYKDNTDLGLTQFGLIHFVNRQKVEVEDETKIPREYFSVDLAKVKRALKDNKVIPGIKVTNDVSVSL